VPKIDDFSEVFMHILKILEKILEKIRKKCFNGALFSSKKP